MSEIEFEDILFEVGGYGKYQKHLTWFFLIPVFSILPCFWLNFFFMVQVPEHWCHVPELDLSNLTVAQKRNLVSDPSNPSCAMYNRNYTLVVHLGQFIPGNETEKIVPCKSGWEYDDSNYDVTASTKYNLVCGYDHFPNLLLTLPALGSVFLTPVLGMLSDRYGRKIVFLSLAFFGSLTELLSVLVNGLVLFALLRTLNGIVFPTMFMLPYILISEIVSPEKRGLVNGVVNCSWTFGLCVLPFVAYLARHWVTLGLLSTAFGTSLLLYWKYFPESPSWLVSQGRYEDAAKIILEIGEKNNKPQNQLHILSQLQKLGEKIEKTKEAEKHSGWNLLKYPRLRRNFFILVLSWITFYAGYGGLTYNIPHLSGSEFLNFFWLSLVEIPGNLLFWFLMDRIGRRWTASIGYIAMGVTTLLPLLDFPYSDVVGSALSKLLIAGLFMVSDQQGMELFPTPVRSFCIGSGKTLSSAVSFAVPYIAYLSNYGKWIPFVLIGSLSAATGFAVAFLPETLNENLPQTVTEAEDFGRDREFFSWKSRRAFQSVNQDGDLKIKEMEALNESVEIKEISKTEHE